MMRQPSTSITLCFWVAVPLFWGPVALGQPDEMPFGRLSTREGLSNSGVHCVVQDRKGFLWFGTQDGLNRYDGYQFTVFRPGASRNNGLLSGDVRQIFEDRHGWLWIIFTNGGLSLYNPVTHTFTPQVHEHHNPGSLSSNHITAYHTDRDGTVWIGTNHGLNRYDRASKAFRRYKNLPAGRNGLTGNYITCLSGDRAGNLWVGTSAGLNRIDRLSGQITRVRNTADDASLSSDAVTALLEDRDGYLWVGTRWGLNRSRLPLQAAPQPAGLTFQRFFNEPYKPGKANRQNILCLLESRRGDLWVGTPHGVSRLLSKSGPGTFRHYLSEAEYGGLAGGHPVDLIREDSKGTLWVAATSSGSGLFRLDPGQAAFTRYGHDPLDPLSLSNSEITCLAEDRLGMLWVGTWKGGINLANRYRKEFHHYRHLYRPAAGLNDNAVFAIEEDDRGDVWIGTRKGLNRLDRRNHRYTSYQPDPRHPDAMPSRTVGVIRKSPGGFLWLGFFDGKVSRFYPGRNRFENYRHQPGDSGSFRAWSPRSLLTDREGVTWFGTCSHTLVRLEPDVNTFRYYQPEPADGDQTTENVGWAIIEADPAHLWLGTRKSGLVRFNKRTGQFGYFRHDPSYPGSLSNNDVRCLYRDGTGTLWVGTYGGGLNRFDPRTGRFTRYTTRQGLPSNVIHGILGDAHGNLWLSTNQGLGKFNPRRGTCRNYSAEDGLQGNEFNEGAYLKSRSGELFFGGSNGVTSFFPDRIRNNPFPPPLALTQLKLFNQPVGVGDTVRGSVLLPHALSYTRQITFTHRQYDFTLEFAALHYASPSGIRYAYRMEPYDQEWKHTDAGRRYATYTNLPAGSYTFRVKAANSDGVWNERGVALQVLILPPWWQTWWFRALVLLLTIAGLAGFYYYRLRRARRVQALLEATVAARTQALEAAKRVIEQRQEEILAKNHELQERMRQGEIQKREMAAIAQQLHEADQAKIEFFTNVSHELRTPLSLILGPLDHLLAANGRVADDSLASSLRIMQRNAGRLLKLINQLLELRRLEHNQLRYPVKRNLEAYAAEITEGFRPVAEKNGIGLFFESSLPSPEVCFDGELVETVLHNLLANALKFTPDNGRVEVQLGQREHWVTLDVKDNGIGIHPGALPHVFDRFYRAGVPFSRWEGSGIGLSLCRELITRHGGSITATSVPGRGSHFQVRIPAAPGTLADVALPVAEAAGGYGAAMPGSQADPVSLPALPARPDIPAAPSPAKELPLVLLVEDNADLREFLHNSLGVYYQVRQAPDGQQGWEQAREIVPDLIVSDVMMPGMDGIELCRKLKSDPVTCHIPLILLTARPTFEHQVQGLESGADDYVVKPFNVRVLQLRMEKLLSARRHLSRRMETETALSLGQIAEQSADARFLRKVIALVTAHMSDPDFDPSLVFNEMQMSRATFYRKLKAVTNQSVNVFIRTVRLKCAAELLWEGRLNVSEVSWQVGFSDLAYFTRSFRSYFGVPPSKYPPE